MSMAEEIMGKLIANKSAVTAERDQLLEELKRLRAGQAREKILRDAINLYMKNVDELGDEYIGGYKLLHDALKQADAVKGIE